MTTMTAGSSLEHPIGPDGIVKLRLRDGEIRLRAVDGETVRVRERGGRDLASLFSIDLGTGSADLSSGDGDGGRHGRGHAEIEVDLPHRATVVVETTSAEIEADGLLGDQRYRTTSGEVTLTAAGGRIAVEAVSGDLDIVATDDSDLAIRTVSGDVAVRAATVRSLRATTTSGDLKLAGRLAGPGPFAIETVSGDGLLAPAGDLRIEMTTLSGDLSSAIGERVQGGRGHRSLSVGTGGPALTFRSMSGDLRVVRPSPVSPPARAERTAPAAPASAAAPTPPSPPQAPDAPDEPDAPAAPDESDEPVAVPAAAAVQNGAIAAAYDEARLRILRSLERGEIDVTEAGRRFEALDSADSIDPHPVDPASDTTRIPAVEPSDA